MMKQKKIYVGNLPFGTTEEALSIQFSQYGKIEEMFLIKDRLIGQMKGFGFITFSAQQEAESALEMNGQPFDGRSLKVCMAQKKINSVSRSRW
ncbi:TPA: RNA-binding protein [Legionella pneumophila]|nr:RNA-binding protein [Legionella pneumophila]HAT9877234.1 RNA-binding protein [Legionella pneumophila subsp. pneumophila]HAT7912487.1 RNA-binding protein [Legionella pneumophila]HAT7915503.1 RNA-binding protein [Legionella pneumophila]HAT7982323.1 RNA-binding protein [Legionella pneumophila]